MRALAVEEECNDSKAGQETARVWYGGLKRYEDPAQPRKDSPEYDLQSHRLQCSWYVGEQT